MKIVLVNGSPKAKGSTSGLFLKELDTLLTEKGETTHFQWNRPHVPQGEIEEILGGDAVVFIFPLYVDAVPSHLLRLLQEMERYIQSGNITPKLKVYAVVNCGFYEGEQNHLALEIMENWCRRCGLAWGMGIGIGGAPMLGSPGIPLGQGIRKDMGKAFFALSEAIISGSGGENRYSHPNFPRLLYINAAHMGWRFSAKQNGLKQREIIAQ